MAVQVGQGENSRVSPASHDENIRACEVSVLELEGHDRIHQRDQIIFQVFTISEHVFFNTLNIFMLKRIMYNFQVGGILYASVGAAGKGWG